MAIKEQNIYQKLLVIQQNIVGLGKDKAGFNYRYVTGDKVLEHLKPLMNSLGLILKQEVLSIDNERMDYLVGKERKETTEILSKVMMRFTWVDCETGETDVNLWGANGMNAFDKGVGSAFTYGERYFLLKFFHIATDEDDIDNPESKKVESIPVPRVTPLNTEVKKEVANSTAPTSNSTTSALQPSKEFDTTTDERRGKAKEVFHEYYTKLKSTSGYKNGTVTKAIMASKFKPTVNIINEQDVLDEYLNKEDVTKMLNLYTTLTAK